VAASLLPFAFGCGARARSLAALLLLLLVCRDFVRAGEEISAELQKANAVYVAHGLHHPRAGV